MTLRIILTMAMLIGVGAAPALAAPLQQSLEVTQEPGVRSPIDGDPGVRSFNPHWTARQWARADRQGPGTENGNQPDRAAAGGGGR